MAVLGKVQDYTKNVIKSTVFASAEVVGNLMPTVHDFTDENKEIFVTAYSAVRDYKKTFQKIHAAITKSKVYEAVDTAWKNALDDLKTGNFYNKAREAKAEEAAFSMDSFGGEDFGGGGDGGLGDLDVNLGDDFDKLLGDTDDFGLGEDGEEMDISDGDVLVAKTVTSTGQNVANTIAGTQVKATDAMMKSARINTNILYTQNEKMMGIQQTGFGNAITALENITKFNTDVMQKHVDNATKFFTEQSKLDTERNAMMKEMLEMQRNLYKAQMGEEEEKEKKKKLRFGDFVSSSGALSIEGYFENVKQNIGTAIENSQFSLLKNLMNMEGMGENPLLMFAQSPLSFIATGLAGMMLGPQTQKVMTNFDRTLGGIAGKVISDFNHMAKMDEGGFWSVIGQIFGSRDTVRGSLDPANYKRGQMPWDGESKKALVEVIPQYLASIEAALTGRPHRLFDYKTGMFVDSASLEKSFKDIQDRAMQKGTGDFIRGIMEYTDERQFKRKSLDDQRNYFKNIRQLQKALFADSHIMTELQSLVGPRAITGEEAESKKQDLQDLIGFIGYNGEQDLNMILKAMGMMEQGKGDHKNAMTGIFQEILEARTALDREMQTMNDDPTAIMRQLFNRGYVDRTNEDGIVTTNKTDLIHRLDLNQMKDKYRANIFDYLRGIQRELITIRKRGFGIVSPGGRSGDQSDVRYYRDREGNMRSTRRRAGPLPVAQDSELAGTVTTPDKMTPEAVVKEAKRRERERWTENWKNARDKSIETAKSKKGYKGALYVDWEDTTDPAKLAEYDQEQSVKMLEQFEKIKKRENEEQEANRGWASKIYRDFKETNKAKYQEQWKSIQERGFLDTLLQAEGITEKWAVFRVGLENLASKPADFLTKHMEEADEHLYRFFFKEEEKVLKNGEKVNGFFGRMKWEMENVFDKMNQGLDKYLFQPLKDKLGVEGPWDAVKKAFQFVGIDIDTVKDQIKESAGGLLGPIRDNIVDTFTSQFEETRRELEEIDRIAREKLELEQKKSEEGTTSSSSSSSTTTTTYTAPKASTDEELVDQHIEESLKKQYEDIDKLTVTNSKGEKVALDEDEKARKKQARRVALEDKYKSELSFDGKTYGDDQFEDLYSAMMRDINYKAANDTDETKRLKATKARDILKEINDLRSQIAKETDGGKQKALNDKLRLKLMELKGDKNTVAYYNLLNKILAREKAINEGRTKERASWGKGQEEAYNKSQEDRKAAEETHDKDIDLLRFDANKINNRVDAEKLKSATERIIKYGSEEESLEGLTKALGSFKTQSDMDKLNQEIADLQQSLKNDQEAYMRGSEYKEVTDENGNVVKRERVGSEEGSKELSDALREQTVLLRELEKQREVFQGLLISDAQMNDLKKILQTRTEIFINEEKEKESKEKAEKEEERKKRETTISSDEIDIDTKLRAEGRTGHGFDDVDLDRATSTATKGVQTGYQIFSRKAKNEQDKFLGDHRGFEGLTDKEKTFVQDFIHTRPTQAFDMRYKRDIDRFLADQLLITDDKMREDMLKSFRRDFKSSHGDLDRLFDSNNIAKILQSYQSQLDEKLEKAKDKKAKERAEEAKKRFEESKAISKMEGRTGDIYGDKFRTDEEKKIETGELLTLDEREPGSDIDIGFETLSINENILQAIKDLPKQIKGDFSNQTIKDTGATLNNSLTNVKVAIDSSQSVLNKIESSVSHILANLQGRETSEPPPGTGIDDSNPPPPPPPPTAPPEGAPSGIVKAEVDLTPVVGKLDTVVNTMSGISGKFDSLNETIEKIVQDQTQYSTFRTGVTDSFAKTIDLLKDVKDAIKEISIESTTPGHATGTPSFSGGGRGLSAITKGELFISPKGQVSEAPATGIYSIEKGTAVVPKAFNPMNKDKDKFDIQSQIAGEMAAKKDFSKTMANYFKDVVPGFATGTPEFKVLEIKDEKKYMDDIAKSIFEAVDVNAEGTHEMRLDESSRRLHEIVEKLQGNAGKLSDKEKADLMKAINTFIKKHEGVKKEQRELVGTEPESEVWAKARDVIRLENKDFKSMGIQTIRTGETTQSFEDFNKKTDDVDKSRRIAHTIETENYFKDNTITKNVLQGVNNFKESMVDAIIQVTGLDSKEVKDATKDIGKQVMDGIPNTVGKGLLGGAVGLFLGGPLVGAMLGGAIGFVQTNENIKKALFGEKLIDKEGNEVGRAGGLISRDIYDVFAKYAPSMKNVGIAGMLAGLITPFGPLGGALIGAGLGALKANDDFQEFMFGTEDKDNGLISKKTQKFFKKAMPNVAAAAVGGALLGPFGLVGNLMLGGATGMFATTETFKEHIFGRLAEDGTRQGGLLNALKKGILDPWVEFGKKVKDELFEWVKYDVFGPLKNAFAPIGKQVQLAVTGMFKGVSQFLAHWYKVILGRPIATWLQEKFMTPINKFATQLLGTVLKPAKWLLSRPSAMIGAIGNMFRRRQVQMGNADYMTAGEREVFRREHGMDYNEKELQEKLNQGTISDRENWALFDKRLSKLATNKSAVQSAIDAAKLFRDSEKGVDEVKDDAVKKLWATIHSQIGRGQKEFAWVDADRDKINKLIQAGKDKEALDLFRENLDKVVVTDKDGKKTTGLTSEEKVKAFGYLTDASRRLKDAQASVGTLKIH